MFCTENGEIPIMVRTRGITTTKVVRFPLAFSVLLASPLVFHRHSPLAREDVQVIVEDFETDSRSEVCPNRLLEELLAVPFFVVDVEQANLPELVALIVGVAGGSVVEKALVVANNDVGY
jgi:hypothetical protein